MEELTPTRVAMEEQVSIAKARLRLASVRGRRGGEREERPGIVLNHASVQTVAAASSTTAHLAEWHVLLLLLHI